MTQWLADLAPKPSGTDSVKADTHFTVFPMAAAQVRSYPGSCTLILDSNETSTVNSSFGMLVHWGCVCENMSHDPACEAESRGLE